MCQIYTTIIQNTIIWYNLEHIVSCYDNFVFATKNCVVKTPYSIIFSSRVCVSKIWVVSQHLWRACCPTLHDLHFKDHGLLPLQDKF